MRLWLGPLTSFAPGYGISRRVRGDSLSGSALAGLGSSVSNSGFVGYPIVVMVVGSAGRGGARAGHDDREPADDSAGADAGRTRRQSDASVWRALSGTLKSLVRHPVLIAITLGLTLAVPGCARRPS